MSKVVCLATFREGLEVENEIEYHIDSSKPVGRKAVGVSCSKWPFRIARDGDKVSIMCKKTGDTFGELDRDIFNRMLLSWLLVDNRELVESASRKEGSCV